MKQLHGTASGINEPVMGRVTRRKRVVGLSRQTIYVGNGQLRGCLGHRAAIVSSNDGKRSTRIPSLTGVSLEELACLNEGDVILLQPSGTATVLWDVTKSDNSLLVTNTCNCYCVMCPQPSSVDPPGQLDFNLSILRLLKGTTIEHIGITGGEPTLRMDDLCKLLQVSRDMFPSAAVSLLTNGKRLSDMDVASSIADVHHPELTFCVALYADVDTLHDEIVEASGSFAQTVRGLHNLALLRQNVEIRVVILKQNWQRLPSLAEFIYRNFPFSGHIAFMGMETTGLAAQHIQKVWVDPMEYTGALETALTHLRRRDLRCSVYNLPLCLLPEPLWKYARDSISNWKKTLLPECAGCSAANLCPGVFATSEKHSNHIHPLQSNPGCS